MISNPSVAHLMRGQVLLSPLDLLTECIVDEADVGLECTDGGVDEMNVNARCSRNSSTRQHTQT